MKFEFKKPVELDGKETKELDYNFSSLKGGDVLEIFNDLRESKHAVIGAYEADPVVGAAFFAKASDIDINDVSLFKGKDYLRCSGLARKFFNDSYVGIDINSNKLDLTEVVTVDGDGKNSIEFDFDDLTGQDIINTIDELRKLKHIVTGSYEMDPVVCASLFAKASGLKIEEMNILSARDYLRASNLGRIFFATSLDGGQAKETSGK